MPREKWPVLETDVAVPVVQWLETEGWDVYQEVGLGYARSTADIVALRGPLVMVVETKRTMSLEVLGQAIFWSRYAHLTSVAVPASRQRGAGEYAVNAITRHCGVGVYRVSPPGRNGTWGQVSVEDSPRLNRRPACLDLLRRRIDEGHKTHAKAGTQGGGRYTPFRGTVERVERHVMCFPGKSLAQIVKEVPHHYSSDAVARSTIANLVKAKVIKGIRLERDGRGWRVYPVDPVQERGAI